MSSLMMVNPDVLYRYVDVVRQSWDEDGDPVGETWSEIHLQEYQVFRRTPKGAWIYTPGAEKRFVRLSSKKCWAWNTIEQARDSFIKRKVQQMRILKVQLKRAELVHNYMERIHLALLEDPTDPLGHDQKRIYCGYGLHKCRL